MFQVSAQFLTKISDTVRKVMGRVEVFWTDPYFLRKSLNYTVTSDHTNYHCLPEEVMDEKHIVKRRWFHFDGQTPLSYGMFPAPATLEQSIEEDAQMGWWSSTRSDGSGNFSPNAVLTVNYPEPRAVFDVTVAGDNAWYELPVDFDVELYSENGSYTIEARDNFKNKWDYTLPDSVLEASDPASFDFRSVEKMVLRIYKINASNRVAKISSFVSTNKMVFEGDDIFSENLLEEIDLSEGTLPIGTVSANEIDIRLNNIEDKFFVDNTESILNTSLLPFRKVKAYIGVQTGEMTYEWVPFGEYWSKGWNALESSAHVSVTCRDRMDLLRKMQYITSEISYNKTLFSLAKDVLEDAKLQMPDLEYEIDEDLKETVIPKAYIPASNYMEALRLIAEASLGTVYVDRLGVVQVGGPDKFSGLAPWELGDYVWVFDDGEELVGEEVEKSFTTKGPHSGILYITEAVTGNVTAQTFWVEVRDTEVEEITSARLEDLDGNILERFDKVTSSPLVYKRSFFTEGSNTFVYVGYSSNLNYRAERTFTIEVRSSTPDLNLSLASDSSGYTATRTAVGVYDLLWTIDGSKIVTVNILGTETTFTVEVRPVITYEWTIARS